MKRTRGGEAKGGPKDGESAVVVGGVVDPRCVVVVCGEWTDHVSPLPGWRRCACCVGSVSAGDPPAPAAKKRRGTSTPQAAEKTRTDGEEDDKNYEASSDGPSE